MVDQTSVYPHEVNFLQCNGLVDLIDPVVIRLPGKYTSEKYTFDKYTFEKYTIVNHNSYGWSNWPGCHKAARRATIKTGWIICEFHNFFRPAGQIVKMVGPHYFYEETNDRRPSNEDNAVLTTDFYDFLLSWWQ